MYKAVKILKPGLFTSVQDNGRYGFQKFGMPVCGAMDYFSFKIGNILVGNEENASALEITVSGPVLEFLADCAISICGANISPELDDKPFPMWFSRYIRKGQVLSFGRLVTGARTYLCISGGINVDKILNSSSTYTAGHLGGFDGRPLAAGDELGINSQSAFKSGFGLGRMHIPSYDINDPIHVITGPDIKSFTAAGIKTFLNSEYVITNKSNRMGYRLDGEKIEHNGKADIISSAVNIGTVQVPKDGNPIILMSDRQTTGGYARIGNVITADIPKVAQRLPGQKIRFREIPLDEAHNKYKYDVMIISKVKNYVT